MCPETAATHFNGVPAPVWHTVTQILWGFESDSQQYSHLHDYLRLNVLYKKNNHFTTPVLSINTSKTYFGVTENQAVWLLV